MIDGHDIFSKEIFFVKIHYLLEMELILLNKIKTILIAAVMSFSAICFYGCGDKAEDHPLTEDILQASLSTAIKEDIDFDKMENFTDQIVEINEEELNKLKEIYSSRVEYEVHQCTADISSVSMNASVEYRLVFAYNAEWKCVYDSPFEKETWLYTAKEKVSNKQIMDDLQTYQFGSIELGKVGDDRYSSIEIKSRSKDKENKDIINLAITAKLDFCNVYLNSEVVYYFVEGEWILGEITPEDISLWNVEFNSGYEISEILDDVLLSKLTTKDEFLTYVVNSSYYESQTLHKDYYDCQDSELTTHYTFDVKYTDIGSVKYEISVYYEWMAYEWSSPEITVQIKSFDFSPMVGRTFISESGNKLTLTEILDKEENQDINSHNLHFSLVGSPTKDFNAKLVIPARDNNWIAEEYNEDGSLGQDTVSLFVDSNSFLYNNEERFYMYGVPVNDPIIDETDNADGDSSEEDQDSSDTNETDENDSEDSSESDKPENTEESSSTDSDSNDEKTETSENNSEEDSHSETTE